MDWTFIVMDSVREMLNRVGAFIPKLIGVLVILIVGWLIAKIIETVVVRALKLVRLDTLSEKSGTSSFLSKGGITYTLSELIGVLVYWMIVIIAVVAALNALQWAVAAELLNKLVGYIPNVIVAMVILVLGMFASTLLGTVVRTAASNTGVAQAKLLGQITQAVVMIFILAIVLQQLNVQIAILLNVINILLAAIGLAIGLAFGLGCKDVAGKVVTEFLEKLKKK